jgi:hypothetical protein
VNGTLAADEDWNAGLGDRNGREKLGDERSQIGEPSRSRAEHYKRDFERGEVLLE